MFNSSMEVLICCFMMQAQHSFNTRHNSQALTEMSENPETNPNPCET